MLEFVGTEKAETTLSFFGVETLFGRLEQGEDVLDNDRLEIDFLLVVKVFGLELDLEGGETGGGQERNSDGDGFSRVRLGSV